MMALLNFNFNFKFLAMGAHKELEQTVLNIQNIQGIEGLMTPIVAPIKVLPE